MAARVLVVDDSATLRKIVRRVLEGAGYEVSETGDGHRALEIVRREVPDLLLVDFVMPKLNGYQLALAMRAVPSLRDLPIVLMSARAEQVGERFVRQTRAVDAIGKPFAPEALLTVVAHALAKPRTSITPPTLVRDELAGKPSLMPPPETPAVHSRSASDRPDAKTSGPAQTPIDASALRSSPPVLFSGLDDIAQRGRKAVSIDVAEGVARAKIAPAPQLAAHDSDSPQMKAGLAVARVVAPALVKLGMRPPSEAELTRAIADVLDLVEMLTLVRALKPLDPEKRERVVLEGAIEGAPLAELFQLLRLQQQTGLLVVSRPPAEVVIALRHGNVDLAVARNVSSEFLLGRYLVAGGAVSRDDLDEWLTGAKAGGHGWLGRRLLDAKVIDPQQLDDALIRQTSEVIYEVLRWPDGRYRFERGESIPEADGARLGLPIESLVLEGFRRVDEWRLIEGEVTSFDLVFAPNSSTIESVGTARLSADERTVLAAIDGVRTVREIITGVAMSSFDTCKVLYRLRMAKYVRVRT